MTNAEWCIKNGYKFKNIDIRQIPRDFCIYGVYIGNALIDTYRCTNEMTYIEVVLKWLDMERKKPILDNTERRYLSAVIRPFRDDVQYIMKLGGDFENFEGIIVGYKYKPCDSADAFDYFYLPPFKKRIMYRGMEPNKRYTPEELLL